MKKWIKEIGHRLKSHTGYRLLKQSRWGVDWIDDCQRIAKEGWIRDLSALNTVFDVGANTGQTSLKLLKRMPITRLYCFEPVGSTFQQLQTTLSKQPQAECFPFGLSDTDGEAPIRIFSSSLLASTCESSPILTADSRLFDHSETIRLRTLDSVCQQLQLPSIDLLKIDTEGADLRALRGAERMLREQRISLILFEFYCASSEETGNGTLEPIDQYLSGHGYRLVSFYTDFVHPEQSVGVYNALYAIAPSVASGKQS